MRSLFFMLRKRERAMTKYFAQDTPQASLERMMMSVPGFQRRGGGISFSSFHYKPEDVDCTIAANPARFPSALILQRGWPPALWNTMI